MVTGGLVESRSLPSLGVCELSLGNHAGHADGHAIEKVAVRRPRAPRRANFALPSVLG